MNITLPLFALCFLGQPIRQAGGFVDGRHFTRGGTKLISRTYAAASRYFVVNSPSGRTIRPSQESHRHVSLCFFLSLLRKDSRDLIHVHPLFKSYCGTWRRICSAVQRLYFSKLLSRMCRKRNRQPRRHSRKNCQSKKPKARALNISGRSSGET